MNTTQLKKDIQELKEIIAFLYLNKMPSLDYSIRQLELLENKLIKYPFNEGDDYYTIEDDEVIWSCWDDESEEMHDVNPNKQYFKTKEEAQNKLTK